MDNVKKLLFVTLLLVIALTSCNNIFIKKHFQEEYNKSLAFFSSGLVNHFPKEVSENTWLQKTVGGNTELAKYCFASNEILLGKSYHNSAYLKLKSYFDNLFSKVYFTNDTSLLLIFPYCNVIKIEGEIFKNQESPERQKLAKHNLLATSLPVPLFEIDEYHGNTLSGLPEDFKIYVLEAKPGKYLEEKYLRNCTCLPAKWKHGFSRGVAMSDKRKVVMYWVTVW